MGSFHLAAGGSGADLEMTAASKYNSDDASSCSSFQMSARSKDGSSKMRDLDHCTVINLDEVSNCASSHDSPKPEKVQANREGSELLGWVATIPLAIALSSWVVEKLNGYKSPIPGISFLSDPTAVLSCLIWYIVVLLVEYFLQVSPTVNTLRYADYSYCTSDRTAQVKESDAVRLETHMVCWKDTSRKSVKDSADESDQEIVWQGKTVFPIGCATDATDTSGGVLKHRAVLLEFSTRMDFLDEKSKSTFDRVCGPKL